MNRTPFDKRRLFSAFLTGDHPAGLRSDARAANGYERR